MDTTLVNIKLEVESRLCIHQHLIISIGEPELLTPCYVIHIIPEDSFVQRNLDIITNQYLVALSGMQARP